MNLETLDIITYVCASLGILLFILCIVLVCVIIYGYCRKHLAGDSRSYRVVPRVNDAEDVELASYNPLSPAINSLKSDVFPKEVGLIHSDSNHKHNAPIKKRLFWKNKKAAKISLNDSMFTEEELNAGGSGGFFRKKNHQNFQNRRLSKSDWYIYNKSRQDITDDSDEDEHEALLYPHQVISLIGSPARESDLKQSQYFDALETIKEEQEEETEDLKVDEDEESDDVWVDIEDDNEKEKLSNHTESRPSKVRPKYPRILPESVQRRVQALKNLQIKSEKMEACFYRELFYLEADFSKKKKDPIYDRRNLILDTNLSEGKDFDEFWLSAMRNCPTLNEIIQAHDYPVLKFLKDIRIKVKEANLDLNHLKDEHLEFKLQFFFSDENPYFENSVLTKEYFLKCEPDPNVPFTFEGPEVITCRGCKIFWRKGKNVTLKPVKRFNKETGQMVTKFAKRNSFFNFFTPPKHVREWILDPKKSALMEAHFNIGLFFKETFIPNSILFFEKSRQKSSNESQLKEFSNKKQEGKKFKKQNSLARQLDNAKSILASSETSDFSHIDQQSGRNSSMSTSNEGAIQTRSWYQLKNNTSPNSSLNRGSKMDSSEAKDPMVGKFQLISSEGLDDYLKALGVGFARRKLAATITPTIFISIEENGLYTVRTETNVSTSELKFFLNEQFSETTPDGRNVRTTPKRVNNTLILVQKGENSSKDTELIREFSGDIMTMTMTVNGISCKRVYQRAHE